MSLHPGIVAWLGLLKDLPPTHTLPVADVRAAGAARLALMPPPPAVGHVADRELPGPGQSVRVRLYTPFGVGPFPLTVYFHGGGFVLGNLDSHDGVCRRRRSRRHARPPTVSRRSNRLAPPERDVRAQDDSRPP